MATNNTEWNGMKPVIRSYKCDNCRATQKAWIGSSCFQDKQCPECYDEIRQAINGVN